MAGLTNIHRAIHGLTDPSVDQALAAALPTSRGRALHVIVQTLFERQHPAGLLGLILNYHRLGEDDQRHVIRQAALLFRPLREAAGMKGTTGPENALCIIRGSLSTRLAYLVTEQLRQREEPIQQQAGECLLHMARQAATAPWLQTPPAAEAGSPPASSNPDETGPGIEPEEVAYLQTAVQDAVKSFAQHHQVSTLEAMMWLLPRPMTGCTAYLDDRGHAASRAMQTLLRQADRLAVRRNLLLLLSRPELEAAGIDGLRQAVTAGRLGDVLGSFHLLALPRTRRALRRIKSARDLWPTAEQISSMPPHQRRGLPAYAAALPEAGKGRVAQLQPFSSEDDALTRLFALRRLLECVSAEDHPGPPIEDAVATFCHDREPAIARIALRHLIRRGYPGLPRVLAGLVNSPHEPLRKLASQRLAPVGFARLWDAWPGLDTSRRLAMGRALIKLDPQFHTLLAARLVGGERKHRVRALAIIAELNQGAMFYDALIDLVESDDPHVVSAAVRALGSASGTPAHAAVVRAATSALDHEDGRVRANAIEALAQLDAGPSVARLITLADDPESRPRASAIAALLNLGEDGAIPALRRMLSDSRPTHRDAALWLIETVKLVEVARQVAELSLTDPDMGIRQRADRVIRLLIERMEELDIEPAALSAALETLQ